ncbi:hypothetical protein SAMN06265377_3003 [Flagellimonas pacifica]|uniref:Uncharacterized protein n=2 Tax=Flagellimonas pacifica TaxID=1247520 RepID=A0A285MVF2_9FLAO|nr:hypothetical protein SAMN06265377_3003 [Allomuricauda parva]
MTVNNKTYLISISLLLIGIIFCTVSAVISLNSNGNWFARSGSILTFISVVVQFQLASIKKKEAEKIMQSDLDIHEKLKTIKDDNSLHKTVFIVSGLTSLLGTLIWGYGDLLF